MYVRTYMPLILSEKNAQFGKTFLWSVTEEVHFFKTSLETTGLEMSQIKNWHPKRQKEWLSGRFLIHQFMRDDLRELVVDDYGKPSFPDSNYNFSISHTEGLVGLMFHTDPIGMDLQVRTDKVHRVAHKFCSENDYLILGEACSKEEIEVITWSLKEAVFKAFGSSNLSYKHHIIMKSLKTYSGSKEINVEISKEGISRSYVGKVRMIGSYCMCQVYEVIL